MNNLKPQTLPGIVFTHCSLLPMFRTCTRLLTKQSLAYRASTTLAIPITQIHSKMPLLTISNSINESLHKNEIFDEVLPSFEPKGLLTISYGDSNEVALGNTLGIDQTQSKPQFQFTPSNIDSDQYKDSNLLFTLVLTDPDAPSRTDKKWSEYAHFIQKDIKLDLNSEEGLDLDKNGEEILDYSGPAPPKGTGKHRYVFLLFKQPNGSEGVSSSIKAPEDRINWGYGIPATGVKKWSETYGLEPWAVNFFFAENK